MGCFPNILEVKISWHCPFYLHVKCMYASYNRLVHWQQTRGRKGEILAKDPKLWSSVCLSVCLSGCNMKSESVWWKGILPQLQCRANCVGLDATPGKWIFLLAGQINLTQRAVVVPKSEPEGCRGAGRCSRDAAEVLSAADRLQKCVDVCCTPPPCMLLLMPLQSMSDAGEPC